MQFAGLYIHIPYCTAICPYCDFAVTTGRPRARARFVESLLAEISLVGEWAEPFDTVYLGGGTPSILAAHELERVLAALREHLPVETDARVFLEANPEHADPEVLAAWRRLGVSTLSLGVQSFDDAELRFLCRRHDRAQARASVEAAREAGFDTVSVDLIFGLPDQTAARWRAVLEAALRLEPDHVSCYQLTVSEGTAFGRWRDRGRLVELADEPQAALYELAHELLAARGYEAYEVSNFARGVDHRSSHNVKYWTHSPYLGLGPSAHSFAPLSGGGERWWNEPEVTRYDELLEAGKRPVAGREHLSLRDLAVEAVMLGLRTRDGVDLADFRARFGTDLREVSERAIAAGLAAGTLSLDGDRLRPTPRGMAIADGLAAELAPG